MNSSQAEPADERSLLARFRIRPKHIARTGDDAPTSGLFRFVWRMSGVHQIWVSLIAAFVAALSMAPLELQRRIVNDAIGGGEVRLLLLLGAIYLAVIAVRSGAKLAMLLYQGWLSESAIRYCREHIGHLRATDNAAAESGHGEGRLVSIVGSEVESLGGFVGEGISQPVVNIGMLVSIVGYMVVVEPLVALVAFAFLMPQLAIVPWLQRIINRLIEHRLGLMRAMSDRLVGEDGADGQDGPDDALSGNIDKIYRNRIQIFIVKFSMKASTNLLSALAPLTVLVVGGYFVIEGDTTIGVVVAFITGFDRLASPLRELLAYYRLAAQARVQHKMVAQWVNKTIEENDGESP